MTLRNTAKWTGLILLAFLLYGVILELQVHFWGRVLIPHEKVFLAGKGYYWDPLQFMWFLNWWSYALSHHLNPLYSDFLWHPTKVSLLWITSVPLLSVLTTPLQKANGIVFTYNFLTVLAPIFSATTAFMLGFYLTKKWFPAFVGGFFFGFSPYEMIILLGGDLNLSFIFLLPLLLLVAIVVPNAKKIQGILLSFLLAILLVAEFLVSTEVFAILVFFSAISLFLFYFIYRDSKRLLQLLKRVSIGLIVATILLLPILPSLFHGSVYGGVKSMNTYDNGNDLLSLIVPSQIQSFSRRIPLLWYEHMDGLGYIGIPVIIIFLLYAKSQWRVREGKLLISLMGLFLLLSLGATLHIFGLCLSPLPWTLAEHLPLINYALPERFILYFWLIFSVVVAIWLSKSEMGSTEFRKKTGLILLALLFLWPKPWPTNKIVDHPIFSQGKICSILPENKTLLYFPWKDGKIDYHQIAAHMCFKSANGYYGAVPAPFNKWPISYLFVKDRYKEMSPDIFHKYLANFDVGLVVVSKTVQNRPDLDSLLTRSGFEKEPGIADDPTVEIYGPGNGFVYRQLTKTGLEKIYSYRQISLRSAVIASNRQKLSQIIHKLGFSSDQKFQDGYTWLLMHHILK